MSIQMVSLDNTYQSRQILHRRKESRSVSFKIDSITDPRKSLGYKTPSEVFYARVSKVMAA
jgi:hypothetical protein